MHTHPLYPLEFGGKSKTIRFVKYLNGSITLILASLTSQTYFPNNGMSLSDQVTRLVSLPKRLLNALDHRESGITF